MPKLRFDQKPKYRKHRGSGQAVVNLGGRLVYLGVHGTARSRQRYEEEVKRWEGLGRPSAAAQADLAGKISITAVLLSYLNHQKVRCGRLKHGDKELAHIRAALAPARELFGRTPAEEFGPTSLRRVREAYVGKQWSRFYVNKQTARLKAAISWAVGEDLVTRTPQVGALQDVQPLERADTDAPDLEDVQPVPLAQVEQAIQFASPPSPR